MSLYLGNKPISSDGSSRLTGEIGDMGFAPLGIDESLNLRRYLNGQIISQIQFVSFTTKVKSAVALFPSLATTESNWQAEKALSKFGQVGKFVIDDENQTIRLPAVVNAQGLLDLTGIGNLVNESLPNISGQITGMITNSPVATGCINYTTTVAGVTSADASRQQGTVNIDASRSSTAYQDGAPVQQEAIQYPYYIQVATGIEETLPAIREYEINTPFFFGWSQYFENAPYNASLLASLGQYNASTLYPDLWSQLQVELNASLNVGDTIEISGKTYVKRGLPVKLSTDTYDDYDFVVNTVDETFRLPLLNGEEDLPGSTVTIEDITQPKTFTAEHNMYVSCNVNISGTGRLLLVINNTTSGIKEYNEYNGAKDGAGCTLFAKKGDSLSYGFSASGFTITQNKLILNKAVGNGTLYYYVGETIQDASMINAGAVLSDVADLKQNKADIDLSNINNTNNVAASNLNSKGIRTVVETYKNGLNWYRVWSDGWIEQGGVFTAMANSGQIANLLKPYSDTNFSCYATLRHGSDSSDGVSSVYIAPETTNTIRAVRDYYGTPVTATTCWYACGY